MFYQQVGITLRIFLSLSLSSHTHVWIESVTAINVYGDVWLGLLPACVTVSHLRLKHDSFSMKLLTSPHNNTPPWLWLISIINITHLGGVQGLPRLYNIKRHQARIILGWTLMPHAWLAKRSECVNTASGTCTADQGVYCSLTLGLWPTNWVVQMSQGGH